MQSEQRLIDTLIKHWRRRKGEASLPVYEAFAPEALGDEIWQNCCAFSVQPSAEKWVYINNYVGDNLQKALGRDITGEVLTIAQQGFQAARILEKAEEAVKSADPVTDAGHFINEQSKIIKFRSCLLPFGRDKKITHLVLGVSWRAF